MAQRYATRVDVAGEAGTPGGIARELNALPDSAFTTWLGVAQSLVGLTRWGDDASTGHAALTAHLMTIHLGEDGEGDFEAGPLTAEANGPASRSFAAVGVLSDAELETTRYGRLFVALRRKIRGRGTGVVARRGVRRSP